MKLRALIFALILSLAFAHTALAHATVLDCTPAIGTNLTEPPTSLVCHFTEPLIATQSRLDVLNAQGQRVDNGDTKMYQSDTSRLVVTLDTGKMDTGIYTVRWSVTSASDNFVTQDQFQFGVRTPVPPTATPVLPGTPYTAPPTFDSGALIARFLIAAGIAVAAVTGFFFWKSSKSSS